MNADYRRIETAIRYLEEHASQHPGLGEVAEHVGLSKYHFQRLFRRWAGVSPKRFLQLLTVEHAKELLRAGAPVLTTTWETGLSSPGRLHDLFVAVEAMTPGEFGADGAGLEIAWGLHDSPFGTVLVARTERGVCRLRFLDAESANGIEADPEADLLEAWPAARVVADAGQTREVAGRLFDRSHGAAAQPLPLLVRGTNFQVQVWRALLTIPEGSATTYGRLAAALGRPGAARAVGSACGANRIAWAIPCHRVLRESGALGGYAWGIERKRAMLAWEGARTAPGDAAAAG